MNDEIKEILDRLKYIVFNEIIDYGEELSLSECKLLLNYIINLQQEIEKLNEDKRGMLVQLYKANDEKDKIKQEKEDYKSRLEKAVEYFKYQLENLDIYEDIKARMLCAMGIILLQNGSEDNE